MSSIVAKNPVGWFEIYVADMDRAKHFYGSVFQVSFEKLFDEAGAIASPGFDMWSFPSEMSVYGASGALVKMDGIAPGNNSVIVYFSCEDCAIEESRVVASGGQVHRPKFDIGQYGFVSLVTDSEGNMIGLHSLK